MAVVVAAKYCKATGRSCVTAKDMDYGLKFSVRKVLGVQTESLFPEIYEDSDDDDESVDSEESEEEFVRYSGDDETLKVINEMYDTWDDWAPDSPIGIYLKNAIDAQTIFSDSGE
jgi:hypothetical protein